MTAESHPDPSRGDGEPIASASEVTSEATFGGPRESPPPSPPRRDDLMPLLEVRDLKTYFPVKRGLLKRTVGHVKAVDGVTLHVDPGETLGLVGESGCGKSTVGRTILRLTPKTSGEVNFEGRDVFAMHGPELRRLRQRMQVVFQDPVGSLNPRMTVGSIIGEPITYHQLVPPAELADRVAELLEKVGLAADYANRYPHEFSGGQRQRVGIARALALDPKFIICDEPVSALDVSIQAQILNLLKQLQAELHLAYLFIAHNLAVVEHFCDRIAVMYLGRIVAIADRSTLYRNPRHPYTKALLSAAPHPETLKRKNRIVLPGEVPSPVNPPSGCRFHPRCPLSRQLAAEAKPSERQEITVLGETVRVMRRCVEEDPPLEVIPSDGFDASERDHAVACWYHEHTPQMVAEPTVAATG